MTMLDRVILYSALLTSLLSAASVLLLDLRVRRLWQGRKDRVAVEAVKASRPASSQSS
jgi:hypothetical protein